MYYLINKLCFNVRQDHVLRILLHCIIHFLLLWPCIQLKHVADYHPWIKLCLDLMYILFVHKVVTVPHQLASSPKSCGKSCGQWWTVNKTLYIQSSWNVTAHGDAREGKWRGNWRMEWVASTLHTTSEQWNSTEKGALCRSFFPVVLKRLKMKVPNYTRISCYHHRTRENKILITQV